MYRCDEGLGAVDHLVVELCDDRTLGQARLRCRAAVDDPGDRRTMRIIVGTELNTQRGMLDGSGRNQFVGNTFGLIHRNGEAESDRPALPATLRALATAQRR